MQLQDSGIQVNDYNANIIGQDILNLAHTYRYPDPAGDINRLLGIRDYPPTSWAGFNPNAGALQNNIFHATSQISEEKFRELVSLLNRVKAWGRQHGPGNLGTLPSDQALHDVAGLNTRGDLTDDYLYEGALAPHAMRSRDDLLRDFWVNNCQGSPVNYTPDDAEACMRQFYHDLILGSLQPPDSERAAAFITQLGGVPHFHNLLSAAGIDQGDWINSPFSSPFNMNILHSGTAHLALEQLQELHTGIVQVRETISGTPDTSAETRAGQSYTEAMSFVIHYEVTGQVTDDSYTEYAPGLMVDDWQTGRDIDSEMMINLIVQTLEQAALIGLVFPDMFGVYYERHEEELSPFGDTRIYYSTSPDQVRNAVTRVLTNMSSLYDVMVLARQLTDAYTRAIDTRLADEYVNSVPREEADFSVEQMETLSSGYLDAQTLDNLRAIVYDPAWNPDTHAQKLAELKTVIEAMPEQILGVDVSFAKQNMLAYYRTEKEVHDWRVRLKAHVDDIERQMREREEDRFNRGAFWWLTETVLATIFEPLDWALNIRDILSGQGTIWSFMGFLPLLTGSWDNLGGFRFAPDEPVGGSSSNGLLRIKYEQISTNHTYYLREIDFREEYKLTSKRNADRNIGFVKYNIENETGELFAVSGREEAEATFQRSVEAGYRHQYPGVRILPENERRYVTFEVEGQDRYVDSEAKLLEHINANLNINSVTEGEIILYTTRRPCSSCQGVINQFSSDYPDIKISVYYIEEYTK